MGDWVVDAPPLALPLPRPCTPAGATVVSDGDGPAAADPATAAAAIDDGAGVADADPPSMSTSWMRTATASAGVPSGTSPSVKKL